MVVTAAVQGKMGRFGSISVAGNRDKAFRAARRHSTLVRVLRKLLPLAAIACLAVYAAPAMLSFKGSGEEIAVDRGPPSSEDLKMQKPHVKGTHPTQGEYDVRAEYGIQNLTDRDRIVFEKIDGDLVSPAGEKTTLTAPGGIYQTKAETMNFDRGVDIVRSGGLSVVLKAATAFLQEKRVLSTQGPVEVRLHDSHIRAQSLELFVNESRVVFTGNVFVHLERLPEAKQEQNAPVQNDPFQTGQTPPR